jgi:uncharacterized repeat protein (TIGR01451 family)
MLGVISILGVLGLALQPSPVAAAGPTTLVLQKSVSVNNSAFATSHTTTEPATLTYEIVYQNAGNQPATDAVITDTLQPGQALQGVSTGCTASVVGGFTVVSCSLGTVPQSGAMGSLGAVFIVTMVNDDFTGTIPNAAQISADNASTVSSNTTTVTVTGPAPNTYTLQKFVAVNGFVEGTSANAQVGDTLTYWLSFTNNSGGMLPSVTLTDALQPFQGFLFPPYSSSACGSFNSSTNTVTCTLTNVPAGATENVFIEVGVEHGATTITNQASATIGSTTISSNPTIVNVNGPPVVFNGNLVLCGTVNAFSPPLGSSNGSITINGVTVVIAAGASFSGQSIVIGMSACVTFLMNSAGHAAALGTGFNLTGLGVACGVYSSSGTTNHIVLNSITLNASGIFVASLIPGNYYCFVIDQFGTAYLLLSNIPTSITPANPHPALKATKKHHSNPKKHHHHSQVNSAGGGQARPQ